MNTSRGIFDNFQAQPGSTPSPFAPVDEPATASSPFSTDVESPFTAAPSEANGSGAKATRLPEKRKQDSPFEIADAQEGFGFEPPSQAQSPFQVAQSPFQAVQASSPSPFSVAPQAAPAPEPAAQAFGGWPQAPAPQQAPAPVQQPTYQAPQPPVSAPVQAAPQNDSYSIRQLELRAIFGVDREMNQDEILQRSRALPGIRQVSLVPEKDMAAVEAIKGMLSNLGFGGGALRLYAGSVPIEFIREGKVLLAVQSDGGFAPGVKETLMIVARELSHTA